MSMKEYHTCQKCGKEWLCRHGKNCLNFVDIECDCEECMPSDGDTCCSPIELNAKEKVVFT